MKKLICAAVVAGSMFAMAEEAAKAPAAAAPADAAVQAAAKPAPARPKLTEEQRAKMREQREKFMAERKAAMEAKMLEVVKKYGLDDEKGKALIKDLQEAMMSGRRGMARRPMPGQPAVAPAAPEKKAEAK